MKGLYIPSEKETVGYNIEKFCLRNCERYCICEGGVMQDIGTCPIGAICRGPVILTKQMKAFIEKFNKNYRMEVRK